jgi:plastocyanin
MVLVLGLAACGDDDDAGSGAADTASGVTDTASGVTDAASGVTDAASAAATIVAADIAFDPTELSVAAGETITLRNEDDVEHSFTIDDPELDAEAEGGEEATVEAPEEPGTYDFHCRYHPEQMTGTLTVE